MANGIIENHDTTKVALGAVYGEPQYPIDIDNINNQYGYIYRCISTGSGFSGTYPSVLGSNGFLLIGFSYIHNNKLIYGVQIAIAFGVPKIAIRNCGYTPTGGTWSEWSIV